MDISKTKELYINHIKKSKSPNTLQAYSTDIDQFININKIANISDLANFKSIDLKRYLNKLKSKQYKNKTLTRKLNSLSNFFTFCKVSGIAKSNPIENIEYPKLKSPKYRILSQPEIEKIIQESRSNKRNFTILNLIIEAGLRISEVLNLKTSDFLIEERSIKLKDRQIILNDKAFFILKDYMSDLQNPDTFIFTTSTGKPINVRNLRSSLNLIFQKAQVEDVTVNDLRNTCIVNMLKTKDPEDVATYAGHKTLQSTKKYLKYV